MSRQNTRLVVVFVAVLVVSAIATYLLFGRSTEPLRQAPVAATVTRSAATQPAPSPTPRQSTTEAATPQTSREAAADDGDGFFSQMFEGAEQTTSSEGRPVNWRVTIVVVTQRLALAALLATVLAFRPRKRALISKRNPFVSQTQILLAVVASALMMIVGDSAARAFGIFAAVSLVRFRTNIRDPKEVTVLLISLAIGLATGVGRWELAVLLCFFVLVLLWLLEYREPEQVFRAMELRVKTRSVDQTQEILRETFKRHNLTTEVRTLNREDEEDPLGCIAYHVDVSSLVSTDSLSEEIFTSDSQNIDSVEWVQQKSNSSIYQ